VSGTPSWIVEASAGDQVAAGIEMGIWVTQVSIDR
jgi:hypothetical protein